LCLLLVNHTLLFTFTLVCWTPQIVLPLIVSHASLSLSTLIKMLASSSSISKLKLSSKLKLQLKSKRPAVKATIKLLPSKPTSSSSPPSKIGARAARTSRISRQDQSSSAIPIEWSQGYTNLRVRYCFEFLCWISN